MRFLPDGCTYGFIIKIDNEFIVSDMIQRTFDREKTG